MKTKIVLFAFLFVIGFASGCTHHKSCNTTTDCKFQLSWGEGGGASAMWSGYTLKADSLVLYKWAGFIQESNILTRSTIKSKKVKKIKNYIDTYKIDKISFQKPGNMSCYIKYINNSDTNIILFQKNDTDSIAIKMNQLITILNKLIK